LFLNLKIKIGETVAIVGPSGCGKSTIALLLMRFFEPQRGQILIDGRNYRDYDLHWLRSQVGFVSQEVHLFGGKIIENIALGDPNPNLEKIEWAAKMADAHSLIQKKSGGYHHYIPNGGIGLSGGEKQKIAIARALYLQPKLFITDEASSGLDGLSEKHLLENLRTAARGKTTVHIAHRMGPIRQAQRIIVMNLGRVVEHGTIETLSQSNSLFMQLFGESIKTKSKTGEAA
jgi:ABC-type multidrug transport system fused ATPase/permease subunit